jgi:uncharacterized protein YjiS (DUF1127 family)
MAYTQSAHGARNVGLSAYWAGITGRFARYRTYRKTLNELRGLSPRELDDLGLNPSMIRSCAYKAAYEG